MKKKKIVSLILAVVLFTGGLVNSSTAAVTSNDYTEEELDSSTYDLRKYTTPFWEGNIVYNEIVYPIRLENGPQYYYDLMYDATEIISVKDYRLEVTYEKGVDYHIVDGNLFVPGTSSIPVADYSFIHPSTAPEGYGEDEFSPYYPHADGSGYEYWVGGSDICDKAIAVTYIHNGTWEGPIPESQEAALPKTMEKLINKTDMTIVVAGDSVSTGAMGSGFLGISPFTDAYPEMTAKALREKFGYDGIKLVNSAIGGTMSYFDETKMDNTIIRHDPDLVIINFGMNDSSCDRVGIPGQEFHDNLALQIDYIKEKLPDCEMLLLSSLYGNMYTFPKERYEEHAAVLHTLADEYEGVGVCDPQAVEKYLIETVGKDFLCFMADNMVHPGDFGMRLMAQCILGALDVSDIEGYKEYLIDELMAYADPDSHVEDGKKQELTDCVKMASDGIEDFDDEWDINSVINDAKATIDLIILRCAFEDHVFDHTIIPSTCKTEGYTHSVCSVCTFEYDHDTTAPIGGEHIMDTGRQTLSPTYKDDGILTYTCAKCGYEENEVIPMKTDPPTLEDKGMLHVNKSYNYMQCNLQPYRSGSGYVEMDVCPLDIDVGSTSYIGVWFSGYAITACYNFRAQQVEIINTALPYSGGTPYAYKKVEWTPDSGQFDYNWKKFAVNVEGNTVSIYLDGELVLQDTNELYRATSEVALVYSVGEFYLDNFKIAGAGYDPVYGTGEHLGAWDLDSTESMNDFWRHWGNSYSRISNISPTAANYSTGTYKNHTHVLSYITTVERGCAHGGYKEYSCDLCGKVMHLDFKAPLYEDGHKLTGKYLMEAPSDKFSGRYGYSCENCYTTFTETIPVGSESYPVLRGDINDDGKRDYVDIEYVGRILRGKSMEYDLRTADFNEDSAVTVIDKTMLVKKIEFSKEIAS